MQPPIFGVGPERPGGPAVVEGGLFRTPHPKGIPLWRDGRNVLFRDGTVAKAPGWTAVASLPATAPPIRGMQAIREKSGVQRLMFGTAERLYYWTAGGLVDLGGGFTGQRDETIGQWATHWTIETVGDWMVATNGRDPLKVLKPGGGFDATLSTLAGTTFTWAKVLVRHGAFVLAANTSNGPNRLEWCNDGNVEDWTVTPEGSARFVDIMDAEGEIRAGLRFLDGIMLLAERQMWGVRYVGPPDFFVWEPAIKGFGTVGPKAVCEYNRQIFGVDRTGIWVTDGVQADYIDSVQIRSEMKDVDTSQMSKVMAWYDPAVELIKFSFPLKTTKENGLTFGYRPQNNTWTILDGGRTAAIGAGVFKQVWAATPAGQIVSDSDGLDDGPDPRHAWIRTKPLDMGAPNALKDIDHMMVLLHRLAGRLEVRIGTSETIGGTIYWDRWQDVPTTLEPVDLLSGGRFVTIEFRSRGKGADWAISGFDLHGRIGGEALV